MCKFLNSAKNKKKKGINEWMDGWVGGRMNRSMDGWTDRWMDEWILSGRLGQTRGDLLTPFVSAVAKKSL